VADWCAFNHLEAISTKEISLKCQAEDSFNSEHLGSFHDRVNDLVANTHSTHLFQNSNGTNFC
jgi:hypothetical protein